MKLVINEFKEDTEVRDIFYKTIFDKMHLTLPDIKAQNFNRAENNLNIILGMLDLEGAAEVFTNSSQFYTNNINGVQISKGTYLGKYLCFSAIMYETRSWRDRELDMHFHKMQPDTHAKHMDAVSAKFANLHNLLAEIIKKLMKN